MKKKVQQISLEGKFDVKDILKSLDLIKNALKGQDLKDSFAQKFRREMERVEKSAETIENSISKGFKSSEDMLKFNSEIKSLLNNFNKLTEGIKRTKVNLEDIEVSDLGKRAGLEGLTKQIEDANKEIDKLRNKDILRSRVIDTGGTKLNVPKAMAGDLARSLFDPTVYAVRLKEMLKTIPISKEFSDLGQRLNIDIDTPEGLLKAKAEFEKIKKLTEEITQIQNSGMTGWKNKAGKLIQQYERNNAGALPSNILSGGDLTARVGNLQSFVGSFSNIEGQLDAFQRIANLPNTITGEIQQQESAINNNRQAFQNMADEMTGATHSQIVSSVDIATGSFNSLTRELDTQTRAASEHINKVERMNATFNEIGNRLKTFASVFTLWTFGRKQIEETWETIKKLDEGFASIAMVTSRSLGSMWQQYSEYAKMSKEYGASTMSVIESSALFYQQGLDTNEVMKITAETMKLATLSGLGFQQTTDLMTGAIRGFKLEMTDAGRVTDVYSELAAKAAADVREISYAMSKTASIAKESGMEFETTSAFLTQMIETTRESPENLGSAMKAVIARFQEVSKDPSITVDSEGEAISINRIEDALKSANVALRNANGEFRDLDEVFIELSSKWGTLDIMTKRYIATIAAGSRQQSRFLALLSNHERLTQLISAAYSSAGKSSYQFDKYQDTLYFKINRLNTSWEEFKMNLPIKQVAGFSLDFLSDALAKVTKLSPPQLALLGIFGANFGKRLVMSIVEGIRASSNGLRTIGFNLAEKIKNGFSSGVGTGAQYTAILQNMVNTMGTGLNVTPFSVAFSNEVSKALRTSANRTDFIQQYINELGKKQTNITTINAGIQQRLTSAFLPQGTQIDTSQMGQIFNAFSDNVLRNVTSANTALQNSPFKNTLQQFTSSTLREFVNLRAQFQGNANLGTTISQQLTQAERALQMQGQTLAVTLKTIGSSLGMAITTGLLATINGGEVSAVLKTVGITLVTSLVSQVGTLINTAATTMGTTAGVSFLKAFIKAGGGVTFIIALVTTALAALTLGISAHMKKVEKSRETNKLLVDSYAKVKNIIEKYGETLKKVNNEVVAASDAADKQVESYNKVTSLAKEYDELAGKIVKSADENERLKEISVELSKILPELVGTYDDLGNPILKTGDAWTEILKTAKEYTNELKQQEIYQKAQSDLLSLQIAQAEKKKVERGNSIFKESVSGGYIESLLEGENIYKDNNTKVKKLWGITNNFSSSEKDILPFRFSPSEVETISNEMLSVAKENFNWATEVKTFKDLKKAISDAGTKKDVEKRYQEVVDIIKKDFSKGLSEGEISKSQKELFKEENKAEGNFISALESYVKQDDDFLDMSENLRLLVGSYAKSKDEFNKTLSNFKNLNPSYFGTDGFILPNVDETKVAEEWADFQEKELRDFAYSYIQVFGGLSVQQSKLIDEIYSGITKRSLQATKDLIESGNFASDIKNSLYEQFSSAFKGSSEKIQQLDDIIAKNAMGKAFGNNIKLIFQNLGLEVQDVFWNSLSTVKPEQQMNFLEGLNSFINNIDLNEQSLAALLSLDFSDGVDTLFASADYVKGELMTQFGDVSYVENLFNSYIDKAREFYDMSITNQGTLDSIIKDSFKKTTDVTDEFSKTLKGAFEDVAEKGYLTVKSLGDISSSQYSQFLEIDEATGRAFLNVEGILELQTLELATQSEKLRLVYRENEERLKTLNIMSLEYSELKKTNDLFKQDIEKFEIYQAEVIKSQAMSFVDKANEKRAENETALKNEREALDRYNKAVNELPKKEREKAEAIKKANEELEKATKKLDEATRGTENYKGSLENIINLTKSLAKVDIEINNIKKSFEDATDAQGFINATKALQDIYSKKAGFLSAGVAIQEKSVAEILSVLQDNYKDFYSLKDGVLMVNEGYKTAEMNDELRKGFEELVNAYYSASDSAETYKNQLQEISTITEDLYSKTLSEFVSVQEKMIGIMKANAEDEISEKKKKNEELTNLDNQYLNSLEKAIEKERRLRKKEQSYSELVENERKFALLSRDTSGLNSKELLSMEKDLEKQRTDILDNEIDTFINSMKELVELQKETKDQELEYLSTLKDSTQWWLEIGNVLTNVGGNKDTFTQWFTANDISLGEMTAEQKDVYYKNVDDMWKTFSQYSAMSSLSLQQIQVTGEQTAQALSELGIDLKVGSQIQTLSQIASDELFKTANDAFIAAKEGLSNTLIEQDLALEEARKNIADLAIDHKNKFDEMTKSVQELGIAQVNANKHAESALRDLYSMSKTSVLELSTYLSTAMTDLGISSEVANQIKGKVDEKEVSPTERSTTKFPSTSFIEPTLKKQEDDTLRRFYEDFIAKETGSTTKPIEFKDFRPSENINIALNIDTINSKEEFSDAIANMKKELTTAFSPAGRLVFAK